MYCEGKLRLRSHNTSCCLIEVVTKAGLSVYCKLLYAQVLILYHRYKTVNKQLEIFNTVVYSLKLKLSQVQD